jgi:hypothetical protein
MKKENRFCIVIFPEFRVYDPTRLPAEMKEAVPQANKLYRALIVEKEGRTIYFVWVSQENGEMSGIGLSSRIFTGEHFTYKMEVVTSDTIQEYELETEEYNKLANWVSGKHEPAILRMNYDEIPLLEGFTVEAKYRPDAEGYDPALLSIEMEERAPSDDEEENADCECMKCRPDLWIEEFEEEGFMPITTAPETYDMEGELDEEEEEIDFFCRTLDALQTIMQGDVAFANSLVETIEYLASTFSEKYADADLDTKGVIYSRTNGKGFNAGNASKYLSRYMTTGFSKSEMPIDLKKAIHYCLFEITRKQKFQDHE